jgi:hypothetical protein
LKRVLGLSEGGERARERGGVDKLLSSGGEVRA